MKLRLKKIFGRRKSKAEKAATPKNKSSSSNPQTPSTQPVQEEVDEYLANSGGGVGDDERRDDYHRGYSEELPVKNLLEDLSVVHANEMSTSGDTEVVLGLMNLSAMANDDDEDDEEVPDDESPINHSTTDDGDGDSLNSSTPSDEEDQDEEEEIVQVMEVEKKNNPAVVQAETVPDERSVESPLLPRQLLDSSGRVAGRDDDGNDGDSIASPLAEQLVEKTDYDERRGCLTTTLRSMVESAKACTDGMLLVPTVDNALCQPVGASRVKSDVSTTHGRPKLVRQYSYYNEQFALKILDELVNVGYALVNHQQIAVTDTDNDGEELDEEERDWVGRSVTLILRPGTCNALLVQPPYLEWATLGGGQQSGIETTAVSLLDIHSIESSNAEDMDLEEENVENDDKDNDDDDSDNAQEREDLECFFSVTTKQGQIHVMEAITADESQRLVAGVKNLVARLSKHLVEGEKAVLSDFFDNANEPEEIRVTEEDAMNRLTHMLLDRVGG